MTETERKVKELTNKFFSDAKNKVLEAYVIFLETIYLHGSIPYVGKYLWICRDVPNNDNRIFLYII